MRDLKKADGGMSFLYGGDCNALLQTLAAQKIEDITISEPDLEEIFLHYYQEGGEQA